MSNFVDHVKITCKAGNGGNGSLSFHREKFVQAGGPDGGDGGKGGDIVFFADPNMHTLLDFRFNRKFTAESGTDGSANRCTGKNGEDLVIKVPVGTVIRDGEVLSSKTYNKRLHNLPNLDIMAQYPDGTLKCYYSNEKKADELIAEGVVNVFCFGPVLVREGKIDPMVLEGWYETKSPRQALAMYEPNHYLVLSVLGFNFVGDGLRDALDPR